MSGVSWNSSIGSLFNSSSGSNSIFSSLSDSRMIKSGAYKKLMKSYYDTVDTGNTTSKKSSSSSTDKTSSSSTSSSASTASKSRHACTYTYDCKRSTISTVRNKVLDSLLDKSEKKTTSTNSVLNELLKKDKEREEAKAAAEGTVTEKTETTANGGTVTEATAGAVIDESV